MAGLFLLLFAVLGVGCGKVPFSTVDAQFTLADASWFAEEETLFVFYRVDAKQGLGPETQIELSYRTDQLAMPWTPFSELAPVHTHVAVDCGPTTRCGSLSIHVPLEPRHVGMRLRYHRDGEMAVAALVTYNVVGLGPPHHNRSLLVYGVLDATNEHVQWRARHQFPTLRNQDAQDLGLRRAFTVDGVRYGEVGPSSADNPYGYALESGCPDTLTPLGHAAVSTSDRAKFDLEALPMATSTSPALCGRSTVTDAKGEFQAVAVARKNPEVRPAFPTLRAPSADATHLQFLLEPCGSTISEQHLAMQQQRLLFTNPTRVCVDDWQRNSNGFADALAGTLRARIDEVRPAGHDMVLSLALNRDDSILYNDDGTSKDLADVVEQALELVLPLERDRSTPRVTGAFVFDSFPHEIVGPVASALVLWCPALLENNSQEPPDTAQRSCPVQPDLTVELGPFRFGMIPILPSRDTYLRFIENYSEGQAGQTVELQFLAPTRTALSRNEPSPLGAFATATFFDDEVLTAAPSDAFSYCPPLPPPEPDAPPDPSYAVVFDFPMNEARPLSMLPDQHAQTPQPAYSLGISWEFPFLTRLKYQLTVAGALTAFSVTVPFGISGQDQKYWGTELWKNSEILAARAAPAVHALL
ncbi:MAG: hypothetical protein QM765_39600 [Myxococcales bacterium]